MDWSFFDEIWCINLITRDDRYHDAMKLFDKYNIPIKFFRTEKHPNGGIQGCFESHLSIIRDTYQRGLTKVLIFEDDVMANSYLTSRNLRRAINFMESNSSWDLFYLGTHPEIRKYTIKHIGNDIYKMRSICTHAYVINQRLMKKLHKLQFTGTAIDYLYVQNKHAYGIYPSMFYQKASCSDISGDITSIIPVKHWWFRTVEIYAKFINLPIRDFSYSIVILIIVLILVWVLFRRNFGPSIKMM